jgi:phospholipase/carboxylesterase
MDLKMDVLNLGPLRVRRIVKTTGTTAKKDEGPPPLTVVLMHGFGAPGDDLVGLGGSVDAPPGTTFLFPEAPLRLSDAGMIGYGDARAWWPIDIGRFQRAAMSGKFDDLVNEIPERLAESRAEVVAMLDAYERETKTSSDRIVLGGFSQGSMLATDVFLNDARPFAGLVVLSGTLLASKEWLPRLAARKGLPVFQSHGTEDPILPYSIAEVLRRAFDEAGLRVSFTSFDDGHGIPPAVMRDLGTWLKGTWAKQDDV